MARNPNPHEAWIQEMQAVFTAKAIVTAIGEGAGAMNIHGTYSNDFPVENPYNGTINGLFDAFITKFSPQGNKLVYSTYFGGSGGDVGGGIFVDSSECIYIVGTTNSTDLPLVNPFDDTLGGFVDGYVAKLSSSGNELIYSTYLGGTYGNHCEGCDYPYGIEVDSSGCAYVAGWTFSEDFPVENPYDGTFNGADDVFLTKFSPEGNTLVYSTYLGGPLPDECDGGLAVDSDGCAYVTGLTYWDFPVQNGYDMSYNGEEDSFLTKFSPEGNTLVYSTYLGGEKEEWGWDVAVDDSNCAYAIGFTRSSNYPTMNAYDDSFNGGYSDVYITKFSPQGDALEYSTFLGGSNQDGGIAVAIDDEGCAYVTGHTESNDFPMVNTFDGTYNGDTDVFVTKLSSTGNKLEYSTYLGGSAYELGHGIDVDYDGSAYVFGYTRSSEFPVENAFDDTYNGNRDLFLTKFPEDGGSNAPFVPQKPTGQTNGEAGKEYNYTSLTSDPQSDDIYYMFNWGDGNSSGWVGPYKSGEEGSSSHTWYSKGSYTIHVKAKDINGDVSGWSDPLTITMPKNKIMLLQNLFWYKVLEQFPILQKILHFMK